MDNIKEFNDKRYFITNEKLKKLGWRQTISFDKGLKEMFFTLFLK